ncbi:MAG: division/cell wall cluster transcriptional repressor MraZ [Candidatus Portnoybacteria bacterium]|nr:division/cell wall cluster transcriptional repressor MraZ [Candidatus Portnoybacteria bacterium]
MAFIGEYSHSIDQKKRLAIPAKFRKDLGREAVVTRGLDGCLWLYPLREWETMAEKLGKLPIGQRDARGFARAMLAGASEAELDRLGRILLPDYLKQYAGLTKNVIVTGLYNRIEIWDEARWREYKANTEKEVEKMAGELGSFNI